MSIRDEMGAALDAVPDIDIQTHADEMRAFIDGANTFLDDDTRAAILEHCEDIFDDSNRIYIKDFIRVIGFHCATKDVVSAYKDIYPSLNHHKDSIEAAVMGAQRVQKVIGSSDAYGLSDDARQLYSLLSQFTSSPEAFRPKKITNTLTNSRTKDLKRTLKKLIKNKVHNIDNFVDSLT